MLKDNSSQPSAKSDDVSKKDFGPIRRGLNIGLAIALPLGWLASVCSFVVRGVHGKPDRAKVFFDCLPFLVILAVGGFVGAGVGWWIGRRRRRRERDKPRSG
jgi:hypothetical protein